MCPDFQWARPSPKWNQQQQWEYPAGKFRRWIFNAFSMFFRCWIKKSWNIDVEWTSKFQRLSKFQRFFQEHRNILTFLNAFSIQCWIDVENARWVVVWNTGLSPLRIATFFVTELVANPYLTSQVFSGYIHSVFLLHLSDFFQYPCPVLCFSTLCCSTIHTPQQHLNPSVITMRILWKQVDVPRVGQTIP